MYENVHPNLALVLLFMRTEVECGHGVWLSTSMNINTLDENVLAFTEMYAINTKQKALLTFSMFFFFFRL